MKCSNFPNELPLCYACAATTKFTGKYAGISIGLYPVVQVPDCLINQCIDAMHNVIHVAAIKQYNAPEPGSSEAKRPRLSPDERMKKFLIVAVCHKDAVYQRCLRHAIEAKFPTHLDTYDKLLVLQ